MRALNQSLPLKLLQAREAVMEMFRPHLHAHGVTEQQWRVLRALAEAAALEAGELARRVCLLTPSLSRILRDLSAQGLLTRRNSPSDRRVVIVKLTAKGRLLFDEMSRESEVVYASIESTLGEETSRTLMAKLDDVVATLVEAKQTRGDEALERANPKQRKLAAHVRR